MFCYGSPSEDPFLPETLSYLSSMILLFSDSSFVVSLWISSLLTCFLNNGVPLSRPQPSHSPSLSQLLSASQSCHMCVSLNFKRGYPFLVGRLSDTPRAPQRQHVQSQTYQFPPLNLLSFLCLLSLAPRPESWLLGLIPILKLPRSASFRILPFPPFTEATSLQSLTHRP